MRLTKLENGRFKIIDGATTIEGTFPQIRAQLLFEFEIGQDQLDKALDDMRDKDNDIAEFGIGGCFLYSMSTRLDRKIRAELRAIHEVRQEFYMLSREDADSPETRQAYDRLMFLYFALDVVGNLELLGEAVTTENHLKVA